ncbi:hypothetical protein ES705_09012 [subsurface metagenome]
MNNEKNDPKIKEIWEMLYGFNISEILGFRVENNKVNYVYAPTRTEAFTIPFIKFNFNINKVMNTLKLRIFSKNDDFLYHSLMDNSHILLITAFESYLAELINFLREAEGLELLDPIILEFQKKERIKAEFQELNIDIAHINDELWRRIFASLEEGGLIKVRNSIVHDGWNNLCEKFKLLDFKYLNFAVLAIVELIYKLDRHINQIYGIIT